MGKKTKKRVPVHVYKQFFYVFMKTCVALNVLVLDNDHQPQYKIDGPKFVDPRLTAVSP